MICTIIAMIDKNFTPSQSVRYPPLKAFFKNILLLQFIATTPKLAISHELPTYLLDLPTIRELPSHVHIKHFYILTN